MIGVMDPVHSPQDRNGMTSPMQRVFCEIEKQDGDQESYREGKRWPVQQSESVALESDSGSHRAAAIEQHRNGAVTEEENAVVGPAPDQLFRDFSPRSQHLPTGDGDQTGDDRYRQPPEYRIARESLRPPLSDKSKNKPENAALR